MAKFKRIHYQERIELEDLPSEAFLSTDNPERGPRFEFPEPNTRYVLYAVRPVPPELTGVFACKVSFPPHWTFDDVLCSRELQEDKEEMRQKLLIAK